MAALVRIVPRHPVVAFMVIGLSAGFLTAAIRPIAEAAVLPYSLPLHGFLGGVLDVGVGAFLSPDLSEAATASLILPGAV
jgi:hypothetical protein